MAGLIKSGKILPNHDGRYLLTEQGDILRLPRITANGTRLPLEIMRKYIGNSGHYYVKLTTGKKTKQDTRIHLAVAKAFVPNPNNYTIVDFIDGNKLNVSSKNLRWVKHKKSSYGR